MPKSAKTKPQVERLRFCSKRRYGQGYRVKRSRWADFVAGTVNRSPRAEENGSFWSREAGGGTRAGPPEQNYVGYYEEFDIPDHDCIFLNIANVLPAVLQARNLLWSKVGDSS
jgi:hypothetical protein